MELWMQWAIHMIGYFIAGLLFYKILNMFLTIRNNRLIKALVLFQCMVMVSMVIQTMDYFNITATAILFLLANILFFKNTLLEKITAIFMLYPILVSANFLLYNIVIRWFWTVFDNTPPAIFTYTVYSLFWFIIYKITKKTLSGIKNILDKKSLLFINIICFASFVAIFSAIYFTPHGKDFQASFIALACIVTNLGVVFLSGHFADNITLKKETELLKTEKAYYTELANNHQQIRKIKHDLNNHFSIVTSLLEQSDYTKAMTYCNNLAGDFVVSNRDFCKDSVLNAIISSKYNLALQNDIDCFFNIDLPSIASIPTMSLCSIFANTMDNAIEACIKLPTHQRKIELKARATKGLFSYSITNSYNGNKSLKTDKTDTANHGLGLSILHDTVNKYNGTLEVSHTETNFKLLIAIKI